ncbi:MAG: type II toxin-antitoxin system HicB family antitoxin [Bacteroidales bacterium]|nr:type II toxin-antitoxin system HicB family antitoxin [Bacteroidales bacterium]
MGILRYKGYTGSAEYSEEDNYFVGHVLGLRRDGILYEGNSVEALKKDFEEAIDYYLEDCKERGVEPEKSFSGKIVVRMPRLLHSQAAEKAAAQGISLNEFINRAIKNAVL